MTWAEILERLASAKPDTQVRVEVAGEALAVASADVEIDDEGAVTFAVLRAE